MDTQSLQQAIREGAVEALRACLVILAQRETKEMQKRPIWYNVSWSISWSIQEPSH